MNATLRLDSARLMAELTCFAPCIQEGFRRLDALEHEDVAIARTPSEVAHRDNKLTLLHCTPENKDPPLDPLGQSQRH